MLPYLRIGIFSIPMFSLMMIVGILSGLIVAYFQIYKGEKISLNTTIRLIICAGLGGLSMYFGAHFFDSLFHSIAEGAWREAGITYLGGVVVSFPVTIILIHFLVPVAKGRALYTFSLMVTPLILAHAFGRIGCFCAGCCYGQVTDSWIGVKFPDLPEKVLPTQLFESLFEFTLFFLFCGFRKKIKGHELEIYLIVYPIFRFIIEFFRGDDRGSTGMILSPAQFLDLFCILAAIMIILFYQGFIFKKMYRRCITWQEEAIESYKRKARLLGKEDA